jgi:hypothetical protein
MKNQKTPRDAMSTTTTGTTIAGMRVLRFEEESDWEAAAVDEAVAVDLEGDCDVDRVAVEAAAAEVSEAYSKASVTVLVLSVVMVVGVGELRASVTVSTIVVSPTGAFAVAIGAVASVLVGMPDGPIEGGRSVEGFPILEGRFERAVPEPSCRLWRANMLGNILPACMSGGSRQVQAKGSQVGRCGRGRGGKATMKTGEADGPS